MGIVSTLARRLRRSRRARWVVGAAIVLAAVFSAAGAFAVDRESVTSTEISTAKADRGVVATAVATTGSVEPARILSLGFAMSGTVTSVTARPGEQLRAGEVIAEIDAADAQAKVDDAEESLDEAQDALREAEEAAERADSGTCLTSGGGGRVVALRPAESSPVDPAAVPTATPFPPASPSPTVAPGPSSSVSPSARPDGGPTGGPTGSAGPGPGSTCATGGGQPGGASSGVDAVFRAEQEVISAELALAEAKETYAGTKITAPIGGRLLTVSGSVGSEVSGGSTFVTLADVGGMQVTATFPEADAARLARGLPATVTLADRRGEEFPATVVQVDPVGRADGDIVRYTVVLAFDETPADLLIGQSANVRVRTSSISDVLRLPSSAVHEVVDGTGRVRVQTPSGVEDREVVVGLRGDSHTEIKSGVAEGDEVVVSW